MTTNTTPANAHPTATPHGLRSLRAATIMLLATGALALAGGCSNTSHQAPNGAPTTASTGGSLLVRGKTLYQADGCAGCHSLDGTRLTGPTWKGLAASQVKLTNGKTVTATDAYLTRHIVEPNALTVQGYPREVMAESIESLDLKHRPADVRALVAFIDSLR